VSLRTRDVAVWLASAACVVACSSSSGSPATFVPEAGMPDANAGDAIGPRDSGVDVAPKLDGGPIETGLMRLFELHGRLPAGADAGDTPVVVLDARVSFHGSVTHDYDDRASGLGCIADHYVAATHPAPTDGDAGSLRITGYAGGAMLDGKPAAQPIVGVRGANGYYWTIFPSGDSGAMAPFPSTASPLGPGPVTFGTAAGASFGAVLAATSPPSAALTVTEDLRALPFGSGSVTLHPSCAGGCGGGHAVVRVLATSSTDTVTAWPFTRVGILECELDTPAPIVLPAAAVAAMLASDPALDTATTSVALVSSTPTQALDPSGNVLQVATGRGVFGMTPLGG
jgi:hypothetical protein